MTAQLGHGADADLSPSTRLGGLAICLGIGGPQTCPEMFVWRGVFRLSEHFLVRSRLCVLIPGHQMSKARKPSSGEARPIPFFPASRAEVQASFAFMAPKQAPKAVIKAPAATKASAVTKAWVRWWARRQRQRPRSRCPPKPRRARPQHHQLERGRRRQPQRRRQSSRSPDQASRPQGRIVPPTAPRTPTSIRGKGSDDSQTSQPSSCAASQLRATAGGSAPCPHS